MQPTPLEELIEGIGNYHAPSDPQKLMWDFYCFYALCYRYGHLWDEYHQNNGFGGYGANPHPPVYARVEQWVNEAFFTVKERIRSLMLHWIPLVCLSETFHFLHFTQEFGSGLDPVVPSIVEPPDGDYRTAIKSLSFEQLHDLASQYITNYVGGHSPGQHNLLTTMLAYALQVGGVSRTGRLLFDKPKVHGAFNRRTKGAQAILTQLAGGDSDPQSVQQFVDTYLGGKIDMASVRDVFLLTWMDAYGGPKWYHVASAFIKLQNAKRLKDEVFYIDQLYDVQHNTGTLFSKIPSLYVPSKILDIRAMLRDPRDFEPYVSTECRRILTAFARFLQADVQAAGQTYEPIERLEVLRPVANHWAMARLVQAPSHHEGVESQIWYLEFINVPGNDTTINDAPVNGALLQGLQGYCRRFGKNIPFMFQARDLKSADIRRFIPGVQMLLPPVGFLTSAYVHPGQGAASRKGWMLKAQGFAFDGQVWPQEAFEPFDPALDESCSNLKEELSQYA